MQHEAIPTSEAAPDAAPPTVYLPLAAIAGISAAESRVQAAMTERAALLRSVGLRPDVAYDVRQAPDPEPEP